VAEQDTPEKLDPRRATAKPEKAPAAHGIAKGEQVGAYTLLDLIGAGGMGEVWLARHELLGRLAAVKLIRPEVSLGASGAEEARKRFERETRATSGLRSPHTIAIYDFGMTEQRTFYYAMELLEGVSLDVLVERFGAVPPERTIHLLRGACESLAEAHERGLIHRDVKPGNIFTCAMGLTHDFVKVLDFGLVKQVAAATATSLTAEGAILGSPAFLPPEAATGNLTERADVYALGCVAYWLLTANYVFKGATALEMMIGHVHVQPVPPSERTHEAIPDDLEKLVLDCLEKDASQRPSMREVGDRLASCAALHPWSSSDADAWWKAHREELAKLNGVIAEARRENWRLGQAGLPVGGAWSDGERAEQVKKGIERLQAHFERSHFDVAELDRRIERLKRADSAGALRSILADLPALDIAPPANPGTRALIKAPSAAIVPGDQPLVTVMSSLTRRLDLEPGTLTKAVCVMGTSLLDFRGRVGGPGIVEVRCIAVMGSIDIIVPPDIQVEIVSGGFLGAFEHAGPVLPASPDKPTLRVTGVAVMGSVLVRSQD